MFKLVVADWSGTLTDRFGMIPIKALVNAFDLCNIKVSDHLVRKDLGKNKMEHIRMLLSSKSITNQFLIYNNRLPDERDVKKIHDYFLLNLDIQHDTKYKPIKGVKTAIEQLNNMGIKVSVTTGFQTSTSDRILDVFRDYGILNIDTCVSSDQVVLGRPNPRMLYKCMENLKINDPRMVLKIGDTFSDIQEGKNAGCVTVGIYGTSGMINVETINGCPIIDSKNIREQQEYISNMMKIYGADHTIHNFSQLPSLIQKITKN